MPSRSDFMAMGCMQDWRCTYCQECLVSFHIDHKKPVSRGGLNNSSNLQLLCPVCNLKKSTMTHEEYAAHIQWQKPDAPPNAPFDVASFSEAMERGDVGGALQILRSGLDAERQLQLREFDLLAVTMEQLEATA